MRRTHVTGEPLIKISGEWRRQGKGPHDDVEVRVAYALFHAETAALFLDGVTLTQLGLFKQEDGWLLLLKGTRGKRKLKAWLPAPSFRDALVLAATALDSGHTPWTDDKPRPKG